MNRITFSSEPFTSWMQVRGQLKQLGPARVLRILLEMVHHHMRANQGVFVGDAVHNFINHAIVVRVLLRQIIDGNLDLAQPVALLSDAEKRVFLSVLKQLNDKANTESSASPSVADMVEKAWRLTLRHRGRSRSPKFEIARAWILLRRKWKEKRESILSMYDAKIQIPLSVAFDSLEHGLVLNFALYHGSGLVSDVGRAFEQVSFAAQLDSLLDWYVPPADAVVGDWSDIESFPGVGLSSVFSENPIVRIGKALIAPDPSLLLADLEDRMVRRALRNFVEEGAKREEIARTMLGYVFESYVQDLVAACCAFSTDEEYIEEFEVGAGRDSPEAFAKGPVLTIFEAKTTRFMRPFDAHGGLSDFLSWLRKIAGERPGSRGALEQGARFLSLWKSSSTEIVSRLGAWDPSSPFYYVIVSPEDPPFVTHWSEFRAQLWRPSLEPGARELDARTIFMSIRDLEIILCTLQWLKDEGRPGSIHSLLGEWLQQWNSPGLRISHDRVKSGIGDFLLGKSPAVASVMPALLKSAFDEFMDQTHGLAFTR
ncbi:hypothetical protein [Hyalangium versicolor]|uniref:hypothetical protein n=1 Tax=Hyalangium versicolor TaxID=2861190 RepID=UPI001CC9CEA0|nr:hypothetical protein [Hyalangium versicolor]